MSIPSLEEQREIIKNIEKTPLIIGEKVCPISSTWYYNWKQNVNYDNEIETIPSPMIPIDNSNIITDNRLNQNLIENYNFTLLHKSSYDLLKKWYSGGPTIELDIISNSKGEPSVVTRFIRLKIVYDDKEKTIEVHKFMKISEIHKQVRSLFEIPATRKTRLLDFFNSSLGNEFQDDKYLENYLVVADQQIYLDYYHDKKWHSQQIEDMKKGVSSPASSYTYSDTKCPGLVGLYNLGNSCYFNSGIQCLLHTIPLVSKFVLNDEWKKDLNLTNKIGMKGELANSFASLANDVWSGQFSKISPSNLKNIIGRFRDSFNGFGQQDSHELIYAMLDGIHEDLNRCKEKPQIHTVEGDGSDDDVKSIEAWNQYKLINDSIVVDTFDGLFRSNLLCPNCNTLTVVFDPFRSISIPIENDHIHSLNVTYVPYDFFEGRKNFTIEFPSSSGDDFNRFASDEISKLIGKSVKVKLGAQFNKGFPLIWGFKCFCMPKATVYAFEIPKDKEDETSLFSVCSIQIKPKIDTPGVVNFLSKIEIPFIVDVSDLPDNFDEGEEKKFFEKKVEEKLNKLWEKKNDKKEEQINEIFKKKVDLTPPDGITFSEVSQKLTFEFKNIQSYIKNKENLQKENIKTPSKSGKNFIGSIAFIYLNENSNFLFSALMRNFQMKSEKKDVAVSDVVALSKCFEYFSMPEILDEKNKWHCPKCNQFVCAEKKLSIWKLPQVLIIQLKRFYGSGLTTRKITNLVDFPEILDMKKYVVGPQKNENEVKYRLFAITNQYGNLNSGHYTAEARVRDPKEIDNDKGWYKFNDSTVSKSSESEAHSSAAYVLFYERINNI